MFYRRLQIPISFYVILLFLIVRCAEGSNSEFNQSRALAEKSGNSESSVESSVESSKEFTAYVFEGMDSWGRACHLYISEEAGLGDEVEQPAEAEDPESSTPKSEILVKLDYLLHGQDPMGMVADFYRYDPNLNEFFDVQSEGEGTVLALVAVTINDDEQTVDINKVGEYEKKGLLVQSMRIDFEENDRDVEKLVFKMEHSGHYDGLVCSDFQMKGIQKVRFNLTTEDHDDDDHEGEGHDHDDDDDHEGEGHDHDDDDDHEGEGHDHDDDGDHEGESHDHDDDDDHDNEDHDHHHGE